MKDIRKELSEALGRRGAALVGFADLGAVPEDSRQGMPRGISIAVALEPRVMADIGQGPTLDYQQEYRKANALLAALGETAGETLQRRGWRAMVPAPTLESFTPDLRTPLPHKTVATRAGLGWIGKNALLITQAFGSAVRLTSVLTDAPFAVDEPVDGSRCGICRVCVDVCPGRAPLGANWALGRDRNEFFSASDCLRTAGELTAKAGLEIRTICGICITACPWTQRYLNRT
jgi:epoxyqueuosine reductase